LDSLQEGQSLYVLELRKGIEDLFEYYKERGDLEKQLKYTMRLTALDSIHFNDYKALVHTLDVKYNDKQLKNEKEVLIQQLNASMSSSQKLIYIIGGLLMIMVTIFYYFHQRQLKIKQQFKTIMSTEGHELKTADQLMETIDISPVIIDSVLKKLENFELNKGYIQPNINTYELCKIANVNKKYLVKILKYTKEKGIITYINDLRVAHAMDRLKTDPSFQKYTIKGISEEVGFSNPKSFNKSFDRVFKISAKNFIDELKK
jgi:AraC-like DNA-binding protein